ncbi:glutathione synthase [Ramicandelaber brevisporus]|nr:glutathione synthase [Ramicandelaber brevisporus]
MPVSTASSEQQPQLAQSLNLQNADSLKRLQRQATSWAFLHGLILRDANGNSSGDNAAVPLPISLAPTPYPRANFEQAVRIQPSMTALFHRVASDDAFLDEITNQLAGVDDFCRRLGEIHQKVRQETAERRARDGENAVVSQTATLAIVRSDYMLHPADDNSGKFHIHQVEFNTISCSFTSLSSKVTGLHRALASRGAYKGILDKVDATDLPDNSAITDVASGIAEAHEVYCRGQGISKDEAVAVIVVQPGERNVFDQQWLAEHLVADHGVVMVRKTFAELHDEAVLDEGSLVLRLGDGRQVSVVYYRSAYTPDDYKTEDAWEVRLRIERSRALKCPSIAWQLAGSKKVQQVLALPGTLERFVDSAEDIAAVRECFAGLYPLDQSPDGIAAYERALAEPSKYVLKPQREGGGNNIYGSDIPAYLEKLSAEGRSAYILMDLIRPPTNVSLLSRFGQLWTGRTISELGIYGVFIHTPEQGVLRNDATGYLLRSKAADVNEGGVMGGSGVLDSVHLV